MPRMDPNAAPGMGAAGAARATILVLVTGLLVAGGCARAGGPPGGVPDETPPRVLGTAPDTFAILESPPPHVEIVFDERISERPVSGTMDDAVLVSPRTGSVRVSHGRRSLEVSMAGGFRPGVVYQVTVLPVINDMFRNPLQEPYEYFFSTGGDFHPNVLAGLVSNRLTGEPAAGARVDARLEGDTIVYATNADEEGLFSLRYIPPGPYEIVAYEDQNRNRAPDFPEPRDSTFETVGAADTVVVLDLALLQPDTTANILASANVADSISVRLTFSDFLDPADPLDDVIVTLTREDGAPAPGVSRVLHAHDFQALLREEAAAAAARAEAERDDDPEAEEVTAETPVAPADPAQGAPPLPSRDLGLRLSEPLEPGIAYGIEISGVPNINGIAGGGGEAEVTRPVPEPEPDPPPAAPPGDPPGNDTVPPGGGTKGA